MEEQKVIPHAGYTLKDRLHGDYVGMQHKVTLEMRGMNGKYGYRQQNCLVCWTTLNQ